MHDADKLATTASAPKRPLDTSPPAVGAPAAPAGIPPYDGHDRSSTSLSLHAHPLLPPPALPLPQPLPPPPPLHSSVPHGMAGAAVRAPGLGAGDGGQVMVHWTQTGPSVQPATDRAGHQSADDDEDPDDEDDELLTPPPPRERLSYTRYQLELLNGIYISVRYPNSVQKQLIAKRVGISREQVKIWFQNRRRKDVVSNKTSAPGDNSQSPSSTQDPASPTTSTAASPTNQPTGKDSNSNSQDGSGQSPDDNGGADGQGDGGSKTRMVPDAVVQGCISELKRFSDEKLKERKEKRKAKGKRRAHHAPTSATRAAAHPNVQGVASSSSQPVRLFQAYDMVAPPNKVTPTAAAYLNTAANRFNHSHNTSAFSSPRDHLAMAATMPRLAWDGMDAGLGQSLGGGVADQLAHTRAFGGLGMAGLGMGLMPMSQAQCVSVGMAGAQDSLPVLSDLLSYRQQVEGASALRDSREASLPQSSLLPSSSSGRDPGKLPDLGSHNGVTTAPSPFGLSRVYPFPFVADPPIMLSSLHQQDPLRHAHHWPHPPPPSASAAHFNPMASMNSMDPYKPVLISPLSNPFFSQAPHPSHWPPQPGGDPASGSGFSQH